MKQTTLSKVKDNTKFKLSKRSKVTYTLQTKEKGKPPLAVYTSDTSGITYRRSVLNVCYI